MNSPNNFGPALTGPPAADIKKTGAKIMLQKTFAGGLAPQNMVKHTLLLAALCLLSACDNGAPDNAAPAPAEVEVFREVLKDGGEGPEMVALAGFAVEARLRARAAHGDPRAGLALLDRLECHFSGEANETQQTTIA